MTTTEPIQAGPSPEPTDPPDGPSQLAAITTWAAGRLWMRFASTTARDTQVAAPAEGMHCTTGTGLTQQDWAYRGGAWRNITQPHAWQSYTPTLTNASVGNGSLSGEYSRQADGTVVAMGRFVLGSTSAITSTLAVGLPVAATGLYNSVYAALGPVLMQDTSAGALRVWTGAISSSTSAFIRDVNGATVGSGSPWVWANTDIISWNFTYRGA